MVSTRHHPREFPPPEESPSKSSPRKSRTSTASPAPSSPDLNSSPTKSLTKRAVSNSAAAANSVANSFAPPSQDTWGHTASNVTIAWIAISLPLVIWDACYMLLRPHTMEGGALQWPIWKPYEIYAKIDYVYGWPGWNNMDGFGGGQSVMNVIEAVLYGLYIMIVWNHGIWAEGGTGVQIGQGVKGWLSGGVKVPGKTGNKALLIGFSAALMTASKTLLYYLTEYYSGFANTKHNDWVTLALFYGIMNGAWLVLPTYMTLTFGTDLLAGLDAATDASSKKMN